MAGLLISGPAGAGKSATAPDELANQASPGVVVDFQAIYAALLGISREPSGRYPERLGRDSYIMPLVEYTRRVAITAAVQRDLFTIATNSDGDPARRQELLTALGPGAQELVLDPGREVVMERLSVEGQLSAQCGQAIDRWYRRLNVKSAL